MFCPDVKAVAAQEKKLKSRDNQGGKQKWGPLAEENFYGPEITPLS